MTRSQARQAQSLAQGAAGVALLHIERVHAGMGSWSTAHTWVQAATSSQVSAADQAGLFVGAPAIAFILHTAGPRYERYLPSIDATVASLAHRRVDAALARIQRREPAAFAEYDLLHGLTGIGQLLLQHAPGNDALGRILTYLVRLTEPITIAGTTLPGWWTSHDPDPLLPTPGGHANIGLAHGITGPLALLSSAHRAGVTVDGQLDAIQTICDHLDTWRQDNELGSCWPQWITRDDLRAGRPGHTRPTRPSWCYGTPGIARALQLAAIAVHDTARQAAAEDALARCLADPTQLALIADPGLCHGWAGLYQTAWRAAAEALTMAIEQQLAHVGHLMVQRAQATTDLSDGLLEGTAGLALALHTAGRNTPPISGWDSCLLIT
ncbi:MAG TPA: lanthionine synthetase C family protein [Pseudonocardiaceae bacterium]|nr:lanthionine synthetase C family protein [Pseudonocardiaceae bacterium]